MKYCLLLLALCLWPLSGFAQSTSATISGGVTDSSGSFILGADVAIQNDGTGVVYSATTNSSGMYLVPILPPGHYHVQVSKSGFKTIIKADVILNVQSALALNFVLPVGSRSESVTVDAASALLNTTDASVSTVIDRKFVENIPLNGRSFQDLIQMTPGVVTQSPQTSATVGYQGDFSVNGQRTESNYYTVDGVSAAGAGGAGGNPQPGNAGAIAATTALGTTQSILPVDALQEFRVSGSTYSAEYGRSPGGQFAFSTRSGTNLLHGSAFDYLRNDAVDANDWFNNDYGESRTALRQNDFGGTFAGPVWIPRLYRGVDRSFFFFTYEGLRLEEPTAATTQYVPSMAVRQNAPPALQGIFNAFPLPTGPEIDDSSGTLSGLSPFIESYSLPAQVDSSSLRLDHAFSDKLNAFVRVAYTPTSSQSRNLSSVSNTDLGTLTTTLGATSQLNHKISNDFRLGYVQSRSAIDISLDNFGGATPIDLRSAVGIPSSYTPSAAYPYMYIQGVGSTNLYAYDAVTKFHQWNLTDTVDITSGRHALRFGIDERHIVSPINPPLVDIQFEFASRQSMLTNEPDLTYISKSVAATPIFNEFAAFLQDEWRLASTVTLSGGVRWEADPAPTEAHGRDAYTVLGSIDEPATLTLAPPGTPLWKTYWYNFAPRLGVAWTARQRPGYQTVVRAGGGIYFDTGNQISTLGFAGIGFTAYNVVTDSPLPVTASQLNFSTNATAPYSASYVLAFPRRLQLPYTLQWSASTEQGLGANQSVTLSYVASAGRRLLQEELHDVSSLNPNFGEIYYVPAGITSNYQSLQLKFQRSVSRGLQALATYVWSHSLDFGSNDASYTLTYGNSDFDVCNNVQAGLVWDIPGYRGKSIVHALLNNWSTDNRLMARTAFPITLQGNLVSDAVTGRQYYGNVNLLPNEPVYLYGSQYPGGMAINPAAFSYPTDPSSPGDAPRNFARGFGQVQWNATVRREFHIRDGLTAQFRAEGFNVLNHPNFGYIDPTLSDAQFGRATMMLNQSLGAMSPLYQQGGPRSMQFALKLLF
jgi:hypothetical protein